MDSNIKFGTQRHIVQVADKTTKQDNPNGKQEQWFNATSSDESHISSETGKLINDAFDISGLLFH